MDLPIASRAPTRPALRCHGGKWRLAPFVLAHLPPHRVYVEPFGGAASILLRKPRSYAEIYNDLDDEVVNLFKVLRDRSRAEELRRALELTPYARTEFVNAYEATEDAIERARRLVVLSYMGHGSSGVRKHRTGFRGNPMRERTTAADDWRGFPAALPAIIERLQGVIIEHRPAVDVIAKNDQPTTLFYVDPPYLFGTRSPKRKGGDLYHGYRHELNDADHSALLALLVGLKGMVVLSGYPAPLYDDALAGWTRVEAKAFADRGESRTEVLWINPRAATHLRAAGSVLAQAHLFAELAPLASTAAE